MRYSDIVGDAFHNIYLPFSQKKVLDKHFLAAAHHKAHYNQNKSSYHYGLYRLHLIYLMRTVANGDFKDAIDPTQTGLDKPDGWLSRPMLDPEMFDNFPFPDLRYKANKSHPYDKLLLSNTLGQRAA